MSKKLKKSVPQLRFPEFSESLELKCLGKILDFKNGINADKSQYGKGIKFINVLDIINRDPIYYDSIIGCVDITDQEFQKSDVQYGDVLFQRSSEIREEAGQSNIYLDKTRNATFGGFVIRGRPKVKFNPIYFNYLLKTDAVRKEITDRSGGSTRFNIGQDSLSQIPIFLCVSPAEQEKIASFLGAVDTRLTQLRRKHELVQTYKRGVMQKLFSQQIRFKCDRGKPFPEWEKKKFSQVFERITRKNKENNLNTLTISAQHGLINQRDFFNKSVSADDLTGYYLLKRGDFAYNKSYSNGYPMGATKRLKLYEKGVVSTLYICFLSENEVEAQFYEKYFEGGFLNHELSKIAQEGARNHGLLNMSVVEFFRDITLDYPSIKEQEKIANFLTAIDKKIEAIAKQIELTERFKKGLLQKMFV